LHSRPIIRDTTPFAWRSYAGPRVSPEYTDDTLIAPRPDTGITLKDGYHARLRNGAVIGPLRALDPGGAYAYTCGKGTGWTRDGRHDATAGEPHPRDVVEIWRKKAAA
jgi:hypothetical protein